MAGERDFLDGIKCRPGWAGSFWHMEFRRISGYCGLIVTQVGRELAEGVVSLGASGRTAPS